MPPHQGGVQQRHFMPQLSSTLHTMQNKAMNMAGDVMKYAGHYMGQMGGATWHPTPLQSTVLITGASSGIGKEFAKMFAQQNINLVLVADDASLNAATEEIRALNSQIRIDSILCDLSTPTGPQDLFAEVRKHGVNVDMLINNAGVAHFGKFLETDQEKLIRMIFLDVIAATGLSYLFGREMMQRGHGRIVNISSSHGFTPSPNLAVYSAAAAFTYSFSRALAYELRGTGVSVTCVTPGPTKQTDFAQRAGAPLGKLPRAYSGWLPMTTSHQVAKATMFGIMTNRSSVVPGLTNKLKVLASQFLPTSLMLHLEYFLNTM